MKVNKILTRFYVDEMDKSVKFYENMLNVKGVGDLNILK